MKLKDHPNVRNAYRRLALAQHKLEQTMEGQYDQGHALDVAKVALDQALQLVQEVLEEIKYNRTKLDAIANGVLVRVNAPGTVYDNVTGYISEKFGVKYKVWLNDPISDEAYFDESELELVSNSG